MHDDLDRALHRCAHYPPGFRYDELDPQNPDADPEPEEDDRELPDHLGGKLSLSSDRQS